MAWAAKTYTFSPSTTIASAQVNQNFDDLVDGLDTAMPSGGIIMWSGSVASIPSGWYLCNGSNSTPDLRGRFVIGAGGGYNPGDTGGEATHTLTEAEMPSHTHIQNSHTHSYSAGGAADTFDGGPYNYNVINFSARTTGSTTATNQNTGGGGAHNNLPPYYALAFIMKS